MSSDFLVKLSPVNRVHQVGVFRREYIVWKQAINQLNNISFNFAGEDASVFLEWGNAIDILNELGDSRAAMEKGDIENYQKLFQKQLDAMRNDSDHINLICKVSTQQHNAIQFVEQFLYIFYLCLNITEPGCGGLYARISSATEGKDKIHEKVLSVSSEPFETFDHLIRKHNFPSFIDLNFIDTWNWLEMIGVKNQGVAETNVQRSVFALLNSCLNNSYLYPTGLLWLILGLESLYDLPSMGIASALRERIFLVLGAPENAAKIKHLISDSYAMRSKFVHGRMEIINPLVGNAYLTDEITDKYEAPVWGASNFARGVLVSTLQKMVSGGWTNLHFETSFSGTK